MCIYENEREGHEIVNIDFVALTDFVTTDKSITLQFGN